MHEVIIVAGANGAGKTSFAQQLLPTTHPAAEFVNADEISRESGALAHPVAAGREMLRRISMLERQKRSFAIETTLASRMYARRIPAWQGNDYQVVPHFVEVPSASFAEGRVAQRVAAGGHHVPTADVHRRYQRGLELFHRVYKPLVDEWYHWLTDEGGMRLAEQS